MNVECALSRTSPRGYALLKMAVERRRSEAESKHPELIEGVIWEGENSVRHILLRSSIMTRAMGDAAAKM